MVRLPAPFIPHSASLGPTMAMRVLSARCLSPPLLPVWMNVHFFISLVSDFLAVNFLSVLVVRGSAVCLPTPPSWFSLHWLLIPFALNLLPPDNYMFPSFSSFKVLLKCHLSGAFPNNSIKIATPSTPFPCSIFLYITPCHVLYYIFYFFIVCLSQLERTSSMGTESQSFVHNYILSN